MTAANDERTKLGFLHPHEQAPELRTHKYLPSQLQELLSKSRERDRQTLASIAPALTGSGAAAHAVLDAEPETKFSLQVIDTVAEIAATELRPRCGTQSMSCASPPLPAEVATSTNSARVAQAPASTNATTRISIQQPSPSKPASPQPPTTSVAHTASPQSVAQVSPSTVENGRPAWPLRMKAPHIRLVAATTLLAVALAWVTLGTWSHGQSQAQTSSRNAQHSTHEPLTMSQNAAHQVPVAQDRMLPPDEDASSTQATVTHGSVTDATVTPRSAADLLLAGRDVEAQARYQSLAGQSPNDEVYKIILHILQHSKEKS